MNIVTREARAASASLLLDSGYLWLARDLNGSITAYSHKPFKLDDEVWYMEIGKSKEMWMLVDDGDLYNFVKWEDDKPVNIREWLKEEEREMKLYYVKNGQLESKEVDADFFEKNTTLGGLLPSDELELDNEIVTDGRTIKVAAENSGNSAILEKAKEIDSKILADLGSSCCELTVSPLMRFPFLTTNMMSTEGQDWDETDWTNNNSYKQLTLDNVQIHGKVCKELTETYEKKNADYGNSFENSLDKHGLIAAIVRMDDKMNRVTTLNKADEQMVNDESVRDTLMDLANYAIMSVMWLDNKSGEESDGGYGYLSPTVYGAVDLTDKGSFSRPIGVCTVHTPEEWEKLRADIKSGAEEFDSDLLAPGAGIIGASDRDIYADNQKLDIDKALREGAHPQAIRDFLGGADYDGDTTNS